MGIIRRCEGGWCGVSVSASVCICSLIRVVDGEKMKRCAASRVGVREDEQEKGRVDEGYE